MFTQRGHSDENKELTKSINRRISEEVHSRSAKKGSGFALVKNSDFEGQQ